ncbi:hypothetical protein [Micromonospora humida]|uniref:hypothetical protein n=1 Tax=Micromonospora humida TaxID=2809018 RepID=UPI00342F0B0A
MELSQMQVAALIGMEMREQRRLLEQIMAELALSSRHTDGQFAVQMLTGVPMNLLSDVVKRLIGW